MTVMLAVNVLFALINAVWARDAFEQAKPGWGWFHTVCSAWCAAGAVAGLV